MQCISVPGNGVRWHNRFETKVARGDGHSHDLAESDAEALFRELDTCVHRLNVGNTATVALGLGVHVHVHSRPNLFGDREFDYQRTCGVSFDLFDYVDHADLWVVA